MLITSGIKHKKFIGINRKIKLPSFHNTFGTSQPTADFNYDVQLRPQPNQNIPDPIFNTPAQIEGCGGEGIASVMGDKLKILFSPWFSYSQMCQAEGQPVGNPCALDFILNEPVTSGVQDKDGNIIKSLQWYEVEPINGSLFTGILSALQTGGTSVAMASTWYQSFDVPVNGVVPNPTGLTSGHFWKFCGVKTLNGAQYLIAAPWLGSDWGVDGFCYFSQAIVDQIGGQAFTPNESGNTQIVPASVQTILESLIDFMKELLGIEQIGTTYDQFEEEIQTIQSEITELIKKPMPTVQQWAAAIAKWEGADPASNNPGDLKYETLEASWGATKGRPATDGGFFCQFLTPEAGMTALVNFLTLGIQDELVAFHSPEARTLSGFTKIFAGNPPQNYINGIAEMLNVPLDTQISTFLN